MTGVQTCALPIYIFAFLSKTFGIELSFSTSQIVSVVVACLLAGLSFVYVRRAAITKVEPHFLTGAALVLSFGLGSAYMNLFSPLSQSNAYILHAPLVLAVFLVGQQVPKSRTTWWLASLLLAYYFISIAFSDLNPRPFYHYMYGRSFKPVGILILSGMLLTYWPRLFKARS